MEEILLIATLVISFIGLIGSFVRPVPGPVFSYLAIWLAYLCEHCYVTVTMLWMFLFVTIFIILMNFFVPQQIRQTLGTESKSETGALIASMFVVLLMMLSIFSDDYSLLCFNILAKKFVFILLMFPVAFLGALLAGFINNTKPPKQVLKNSFGATLSYFLGTGLKFIYSFYVAFYVALDVVIYYQ